MSNFLAPAHVTVAMQRMLEKFVLDEVKGDHTDGKEVVVTTQRPDKAEIPGKVSINIYLYHVTPNTHWRTHDLPTRNSTGEFTHRARVALDLHYMLTFFGDEHDLAAHHLMASTARILHEKPWLSTEWLQEAIDSVDFLDDSNLIDETERVKFTPTSLSVEELTKLWTVFPNTAFNLSLTYSASLVFIERDETVPAPALVLRREVLVETMGGASITPASIAGLGLWLRSDTGLTATPVAGPPVRSEASAWLDQSGKGRHATQSTAGMKPLVVSRAIGSKPALEFNGANHQMELNWSLSTSVQAVTVCIVHRTTDVGRRQAVVGFGPDVWELGVAGDPVIGAWATTGPAELTTTLPAPPATTPPNMHPNSTDAELGDQWCIQFATYNANNTTKELWLGGLRVAVDAAAAAIPAPAPARQATIGVAADGGADHFGGQLVEVMVYERALNDQERATLMRYLNDQYGIS